MKKLLIFFFGILLLASCKKYGYDNPRFEDNGDPKGHSKKINVCHKEGNGSSHIIEINKNAWSAHQAHGDVRLDDQDGDGYVPTNACGFGQMGDCNDLVANINPGAPEICGNNVDENCNGILNEGCNTPNIPSVTLCYEIWTLKNLDVRTYRNGDPIPQVTDNATWASLTTGAWCWYNNDSATYAATYGRLYNWYAVNDPRGLAPAGWHVPTTTEWLNLINCLGGEAAAGGALKEAGTAHWLSPNAGATNSSGFTGLPAGGRFGADAPFINNGMYCDWWSSSAPLSPWEGRTFYLGYNLTGLTGGQHNLNSGFSVRCIKD
jgi:uncharacterized protein (TIGR02145 family)